MSAGPFYSDPSNTSNMIDGMTNYSQNSLVMQRSHNQTFSTPTAFPSMPSSAGLHSYENMFTSVASLSTGFTGLHQAPYRVQALPDYTQLRTDISMPQPSHSFCLDFGRTISDMPSDLLDSQSSIPIECPLKYTNTSFVTTESPSYGNQMTPSTNHQAVVQTSGASLNQIAQTPFITVSNVKTARTPKPRTKLWCFICSKMFANKTNYTRHTKTALHEKMLLFVEAKNNAVTAEGSSSESFPSPIPQGVSQPEGFVSSKTTLTSPVAVQPVNGPIAREPTFLQTDSFPSNRGIEAAVYPTQSLPVYSATHYPIVPTTAADFSTNTFVPFSEVKTTNNILSGGSFINEGPTQDLNNGIQTMSVGMVTNSGESIASSIVCAECGRNFSKRGYLTQHLKKTHGQEKPFKCAKCGKKFDTAENLENHQAKHNTEKKHKCKDCSKQYIDSADLRRHSYMHTGINRYHCAECPKAFYRKDRMDKHIASHERKKTRLC